MEFSTVSKKGKQSRLIQQLREDVGSVFERDPAARNVLEVVLTYPGVHAVIWYRIANRLWNMNWRFSARCLSFMARFVSNVDIHPGATIGERFFIDHGAGVVIGETAVIGDDVTLYHGVTLGGTRWKNGKRHPTLESGVVIGAGAKVLGNITIGRGVRVGANSVVVEDIPEGSTVVGIPGKIVNVRRTGEVNPYGIDLNHHVIPDPVAQVIELMAEQVADLEQKVRALQADSRPALKEIV